MIELNNHIIVGNHQLKVQLGSYFFWPRHPELFLPQTFFKCKSFTKRWKNQPTNQPTVNQPTNNPSDQPTVTGKMAKSRCSADGYIDQSLLVGAIPLCLDPKRPSWEGPNLSLDQGVAFWRLLDKNHQ